MKNVLYNELIDAGKALPYENRGTAVTEAIRSIGVIEASKIKSAAAISVARSGVLIELLRSPLVLKDESLQKAILAELDIKPDS